MSARRSTATAAADDVSLWIRLLESHNFIMVALRDRLAQASEGATLARFDLLATLDAEDGLTLAELSRRLRVTAGLRQLVGGLPETERRALRVLLGKLRATVLEQVAPKETRPS